jgi:hypothetical protein
MFIVPLGLLKKGVKTTQKSSYLVLHFMWAPYRGRLVPVELMLLLHTHVILFIATGL